MAKIDVIMPQMGESIAEGTLSRWMKKVGDPIKRDEPIFEISTDKVDAEIPAPNAGVLAEILVQEGETVAVQTVVARIETDASAAADKPKAPTAPSPAAPPAPLAPAPSVPPKGGLAPSEPPLPRDPYPPPLLPPPRPRPGPWATPPEETERPSRSRIGCGTSPLRWSARWRRSTRWTSARSPAPAWPAG